MASTDDIVFMARMVKLLGDRGRLAMVGLMAVKPQTLEDLAKELPSTPRATLERNLKLLQEAEWISPEDNGTYRLRMDALTTLRASVARVESSPTPDSASSPQLKTASSSGETNQPVLHAFFDESGRLRRLPTQSRQRKIVLHHVAEHIFTLGRTYDEQDIDDLLQPLYEDVKNLRTALVSEGILENRNGRYWLSIRM